jgi:hypothetical protein
LKSAAEVRGLRSARDIVAYVGIPALDGGTWPLFWRPRPTLAAPFIDGKLLHGTACRLIG